jgi:hypothetical protein
MSLAILYTKIFTWGRATMTVTSTPKVYMYHSKVMLKDARVGGPFQWHQDYGYWYHNAVPRPDMLSVMVALDKHVVRSAAPRHKRGLRSWFLCATIT